MTECNIDACLLKNLEKRIEENFELAVDSFVVGLTTQFPDLHPGCVKRVVAECCSYQSGRLLHDLIEKYNVNGRAH